MTDSSTRKIDSTSDPSGRKTAAPTRERRKRGPQKVLSGLSGDELEPQVRSAVMALMDEVDRLRGELLAANQRVTELEDMADEDPLVPVLNRRGFERELERTLAYVKRYGGPVTLIYLDLDDFKGVNDQYGHAGGDAALRHFAYILLENVRRSDVVGRLGGDEFALLLHRADLASAKMKADRLAEQVSRERVSYGDKEITLGVTSGATELKDNDTVASVLERADRAMYEGKAARRLAKKRNSLKQ